MKKIFLLPIAFCTLFNQAKSQVAGVVDSITRGTYTLVFVNREPGLDTVTKRRMIDAFFEVYPREADRFNKHTLRSVTFVIDPAYTGVAETGSGVARYNPQYLKTHPEDIDVVTHEVMHIVQDYRGNGNDGWLTEGIADYVRYVYGVNNRKGKWTLPNYNPKQSYKNAYRVTARFLLWAETKKNKQLVDRLDAAMRDGRYTIALWVTLTGETVDQLWNEYSKDPEITLSYR